MPATVLALFRSGQQKHGTCDKQFYVSGKTYYIILRRRSSSPLPQVQPVAVRDAEYYLLVHFVQSFGGPSSPWRLLDIEYNYAVYILAHHARESLPASYRIRLYLSREYSVLLDRTCIGWTHAAEPYYPRRLGCF
ncbi:unnamed protein product [Sphagnum balticum]